MDFLFRRKPFHDQNKLRIFFSGWGMCPEGNRLESDCDLLLISNYTDLTPLPDLSAYQEIEIIAWSLGVYHAAKLLSYSQDLPVSHSIAINGTLEPISEQFGIPPKIFSGTLEKWNETTRFKFNRRMFSHPDHAAEFQRLPIRPAEEQKEELAAIAARVEKQKREKNYFDTAIVGVQDRIFPAKAQQQAWEREKSVLVLLQDFGHDFRPFYRSFEELLMEVLPRG